MRIAEVSVTKLFGIFDHTVKLSVDERVTILYAPNGYGKTILLRMVKGLFGGGLAVFADVPFERFRVRFHEGATLHVAGRESSDERDSKREAPARPLRFAYVRPGQEAATHDCSLPVSRRIAPEGSLLRFVDARREAHSPERREDALARHERGLREWLTEVGVTLHVSGIETERLSTERRLRFPREGVRAAERVETVRVFSTDLAQRIEQTLAEYGEVSQALDRTFPRRLLERLQAGSEVDTASLQQRFLDLAARRVRLESAGLIKSDRHSTTVDASDLGDRTARTILDLYASDDEQKLGVLEGLAERIELLLRVVNGRFLHKRMTVDRARGIMVKSSAGNIGLEKLSSGEQHEIVMLYELLFKVPANSLVLIDEPEISLHVAWQQVFLEDILEIAAAGKFDVLMATHSPSIIGTRDDLTVPLTGPEGDDGAPAV